MSTWFPSRKQRIIIFLIIIIGVIVLILSQGNRTENLSNPVTERYKQSKEFERNKPRLAILVPFRDRFDELLTFVPYITEFILEQNIGPFSIYILNQSNRYRFNRGALANIGFMIAKDECDYIAVHDVDLLPVNKNLSYKYPEDGPYHASSPDYHPNYNYNKYFGGILLIKNEHFKVVNGFSNRYFGWGLEDDEFYARIKAANIPIFRPVNLTTNRNNTFLHFHHDRKRDMFKTKEQRDILRYRDRSTGLNNLQYSITSRHKITVDEKYSCTVYNIEIHCDIKQTPWCLPIQGKIKQISATAKLKPQSSEPNVEKHSRIEI